MSPAYPRDTRGEKEVTMIENFCRRISGVEKAQKKAAVLYEAGMETSRAFERAGLYEALLKARFLEMRIYRALKILTTICCWVGGGVVLVFLYLRGHNSLLGTAAIVSIVGWGASEWLRRKIKVTRLKIRRLDRFLARKGSA